PIDGAITASMNVDAIALAVSASRVRLSPTMPPKAESGSVSRARTYASAIEAPVAVPHGFVCLITAAAGSLNSSTIRRAASRSSRVVYDSSLPWRIVAAPSPPAGEEAGLEACATSDGRYQAAR